MIEQTGSFGNRRFFVSQLTAVSYLDGRFFFLIGARRPRKKSQAETNRGTTNRDLDADLRVLVDLPASERPGPEPVLCCHLVADFGTAAGPDVLSLEVCDF